MLKLQEFQHQEIDINNIDLYKENGLIIFKTKNGLQKKLSR